MEKSKWIRMVMAVLLLTSLASGQEGQPSAEEMQKWMAYATPSEGHKFLGKMVGTWKAEGTMWPAAGAPGMKSSGESQMDMILGGRYLLQTYTGSYMDMPFQGHNLMAYDNHFKRIESIWYDNMGTGFLHSKGTLNEALTVSEEKGETPDILTGKTVLSRSVITIVDDDHIRMEMYWQKEGEAEFKTMEILYTRKK